MARRRGLFSRDRDSDGEEDMEPAAEGSTPAPASRTPVRRGDTHERIRVAAADAADAAEQRAIEEILALEGALERAKSEAATKLAELEQRLAESEGRASAAEHEAQDALAKVSELERTQPSQAVPEAPLAAELRLRTEELEREREEKLRFIEDSDRRLTEIEERAVAAAQRLAAAEAELAEEAERLRAEAEGMIATETERARKEANAAADARVHDRPETPAEERIAAVTERIVRLLWRAWTRWGAPLVAALRSLARPPRPPS